VALQGNIETFALPDVLQLLSSTGKTGRLRLRGDRGEGSVWVSDGALVAGRSTDGDVAPVEALVAMLRFESGDFEFDQDENHDRPGDPVEVGTALSQAQAVVEELRSLEQIVPSSQAWVTLSPSIPGDEITVDAQRWSTLVTIGGGIRVDALRDELDQSDLEVLRTLRDLHEAGVVAVAAEAPAGAAAPAPAPAPAPAAQPEPAPAEADGMPVFDYPAESAKVTGDVLPGPLPDHDDTDMPPLVSFEPAATGEGGEPSLSLVGDSGDDAFEPFDPAALVIDEGPVGGGAATEEAADEDDEGAPDAAEIARQLASLSPKAAKAVAAAAKATTDEEREEALRALDHEDTSLNRDLLLKFLGSVNS
jgi:hypothetical protein